MKIKNIFYLFTALLVVMSSCESVPVVLEFDDSYSPTKPTPGKRDPLPPVDLLTVYAYFQKNIEQQIVVCTVKPQEQTPNIENLDDREVVLRTSIPVEVATKFDVVTMTAENAESIYPKVIKGATLALPADAYTLENNSVILKKGEKEAKVMLKFNKEKFLTLDKAKEYALPLIMQLKEGEAKIVNYYVLSIVYENVEALPEGNNIEVAQASGVTLGTNALLLNSNYRTDHLHKLNDGLSYSNWWVDTNNEPPVWLTVNLKETAKIRGFNFTTRSYEGKSLSSVKVWASQNGGSTFVEQGVVSGVEGTGTVNVSFKTPIQINALKFTDFKGENQFINLYEIKLITE